MSWTQSTQTFELTHHGTTREAIIPNDTMGSAFWESCQTHRDDFMKLIVLTSQDGRSCWEAGILDGTDACIRRVDFGVPVASGGLGATPAQTDDGIAGAHSLASNVPVTLRAHWVNSTIELYINDVLLLTFTDQVLQTYVRHAYFGLASNVDGARVSEFLWGPLIAITAPSRSSLLMLGGRQLWEWDGESLTRAGDVMISPEAVVSMEEFNGEVRIVGDNRGYIYDSNAPNTLHTSKIREYVPTAGSLPGQIQSSEDKPGRTTATGITAHMNRIYFWGMPEDIQNAFVTRSGDPDDLDTGSQIYGWAFAFNLERIGKIGFPIRCMYSVQPVLLVAGDFKIWALVGDPVFDVGVPEQAADAGVSGPKSMTAGPKNTIYAHSTRGLFLIAGTTGINISSMILSRFITIDDADKSNYIIRIVRDPQKQRVYIFMTAKATAAEPMPASTHIVYEEKTAALKNGGGGYFAYVYPNSIGPTAACVWGERVVMGTRTGHVVVHGTSADKSDFDASADDELAAIVSRATLTLMESFSLGRETIVHWAQILVSGTSDNVRWAMYEGNSAEEVYSTTDRVLKASGMLQGTRTIIRQKGRAAAVVIEISNSELGKSWAIEEVQVVTSEGGLLNRVGRSSKVAPPPPCTPPTGSAGASGGSGSGFASGGGGGGSGINTGSIGGSTPISGTHGSIVGTGGSQPADQPPGSGTGEGEAQQT